MRSEEVRYDEYTTGLPGLDEVLHGLIAGDNVVWDIGDIDEYRHFVVPFAEAARERGKPIVYFRFADHPALLPSGDSGSAEAEGIDVRLLDPDVGFELFVSELVDIVEATAPEAWYVFDCLSILADHWYSDRMVANFFLILCPYILRLGALAYFSLDKHNRSNRSTDTIYSTAQVIIETYTHEGSIFLQPQRVEHRHSSTMYMLHRQDGETFTPVTNSALTADIVGKADRPLLNFTIQRFGVWTSTYYEAEAAVQAVQRGERPAGELDVLRERLLRMTITRQQTFMPLASRYFDIPFLLGVQKRLIGSGLIGGKARGILLAQRILKEADPSWSEHLETHDSFFIGADVFYTYIIQNDCWWLRRKRGSIDEILERASEARRRILQGEFLDYIVVQFKEMLEYFGQSPIIVRSSSIQEDSYGNAFSGKYESVFCPNQGPPDRRLEEFLAAVRTVYASSVSEEALLYRLHHGLLFEDEQMALLVQRVSGDRYGDGFFPAAAGVGFSYNPFVWEAGIDPSAGMLRLAFGLGTRAVDRIEDDYTRIVALNVPLRRPERNPEDSKKFTQRQADIIHLGEDRFATVPLRRVFARMPDEELGLFTEIDEEAAARARELGVDVCGARRLTFRGFFTRTDFTERMRMMLRCLEEAYRSPVDIEFTVNVTGGGGYRINLVQCRPFTVQVRGTGDIGIRPSSIPPEKLFMKSDGPIVGRSVAAPVDRLVFVRPGAYTSLGEQDRFAVARLIGRLVKLPFQEKDPVVMLVGPGRWGTSTPAMGVPVMFSEIRSVSILVELAVMHEGLVPDVSLGTHFFNDLVEMDMLYFGLFPDRGNNLLNESFLENAHRWLVQKQPDDPLWEKTVVVLERAGGDDAPELRLYADSAQQRALCYLA